MVSSLFSHKYGTKKKTMYRKKLLDLLADYRARYPEEHGTIDRFVTFVETHPTCFERSLAIGHVTGSAWVVNRTGTHTLLTHHRKLHRWLQLGGHADGNPHILEVALQEVREESGILALQPVSDAIFDIDIHGIPARGHEAAHDHYDVRFAIQVTGSEIYTVSDESHALSWVDIEKIGEKTQEESMLRMQRKWQQHMSGSTVMSA
jgi:8-oxo-dGTP pyrophosphatase MutT (NUDIX family)